jgi:hypothetical protein
MGKAYAFGLRAVEKAGHPLVISPYFLMMPISMIRGDEIWDVLHRSAWWKLRMIKLTSLTI